jgi:hypothetical protein
MVAAPAIGDLISVSTIASTKRSVAVMNIRTGMTAINDDRITPPKHFDSGPGSEAATIVESAKVGAGNAMTLGYFPSGHENTVPLSDGIPRK